MSNDTAKAALAERKNTPAAPGIRELIERQKPEIARALTGTALDPERFTRVALTVIRQSPQLQRCRPESLLGALMSCSQLGLEPGPLGEAYLLPFKDECTFVVGYQGYIKLAFQSGQLRHIDADVVREGDEFTYRKGAEPLLEHNPALAGRGDAICYYAVASFTSGGHVAVVLSPEDVNRVRDRSPSARAQQSPWKTDYDAMACKTAVRRLAKFLPMSVGLRQAIAAEETVRTSVAEPIEAISFAETGGDEPAGGAIPEAADTAAPPASSDGAASPEGESAHD